MSPAVVDDTIARLAGADGLPGRVPIARGDVDGRCELTDGTPIHPRYAIALLTGATLRRLVIEAPSEILDLGTGVRDFPAHLKQAVIAAHRGRCAEAGCDAPLTWLETDHRLPWLHGGPTATHNAKPRCRPHNRDKAGTIPDDLPGLDPPTPPQRE